MLYSRGSNRWRDFVADERGSATIEFVIAFPIIMFMLISIFEVGFLTTRSVMLDRGLDIATRDIRLGINANPTPENFRESVCEIAGVFDNCERDLILELVELRANPSFLDNDVVCKDRTKPDINPPFQFNPGGQREIIIVRACMVMDPLVPGFGIGSYLPQDSSGGLRLTSVAAFVNEP